MKFLRFSYSPIIACVTTLASADVSIYKSIGDFGEIRYTQHMPEKSSNVTILKYINPKKSVQNKHQQCQILQNNLNILLAGGEIHEISQNGQKTLLNQEQVHQRIQKTEQALMQYCHNTQQ